MLRAASSPAAMVEFAAVKSVELADPMGWFDQYIGCRKVRLRQGYGERSNSTCAGVTAPWRMSPGTRTACCSTPTMSTSRSLVAPDRSPVISGAAGLRSSGARRGGRRPQAGTAMTVAADTTILEAVLQRDRLVLIAALISDCGDRSDLDRAGRGDRG